MKRLTEALLCLCLISPIGVTANGIVVFGDSLSDTGNAALVRNFIAGFDLNLCYPADTLSGMGCGDLFYQETRVSNGAVAVEVLAARLGVGLEPSRHPLISMGVPVSLGNNFAVAGATARGASVADLNAQVTAFLTGPAPAPPDNRLYVVFIGGNDVIDAAQASLAALVGSAPASLETSEDIIADAVAAIGGNIERLISEGGAKRFLVVNSPNVGSVPAIKEAVVEAGVPVFLLQTVTTLVQTFATFVTIEFNEQLTARLDQIRDEQRELGTAVRIEEFNLFRFFEAVRVIGAVFGLNAVDACFDSGTYEATGVRSFHPDCGVDKFDDFVFFDDLHPTGRTHRVAGEFLSRVVGHLAEDRLAAY